MRPYFCPANASVMCQRLCFAEVKCNSERHTEARLRKGLAVHVGLEGLTSAAVLLNLSSIPRHLENKPTVGYETQLPRIPSKCSFC